MCKNVCLHFSWGEAETFRKHQIHKENKDSSFLFSFFLSKNKEKHSRTGKQRKATDLEMNLHLKVKYPRGLLEGVYCFLVPRELSQDYICDFFPPFSYVYF